MKQEPSKTERVMEGIVARIRSGALQPGARLRSIRDEAMLMGVANNTVVEAYLRLVAQGVVQSRPGSGYFVARAPARPAKEPLLPFAGISDGGALLTEQLERRLPVRPGDGRLPVDWLEESRLRTHLGSVRLHSSDAYNYNSAQGYFPLRARLCGALAERGITCQPQQMLMTHGANHAMELVIRAYVRPGDAVLVDDPGYYPLFSKLKLAGATIVGVRRDHDGPNLEDLAEKARTSGAGLFFTQSLAHNPTGGSISLAKAYGVMQIAGQHDLLVVEDDPFADILPYSAPRLAALDQLQRVIYIGSFSKTLAGSFRVGYVAASPERATALSEILVVTVISTSAHNERIVYSLIDQGHYLKHLRGLRTRVSEATAETVRQLTALGLEVSHSGGGFYLWPKVPPALVTPHAVSDAAARGIFIAPGSAFAAGAHSEASMRVNVAHGNHPDFLTWLRSAM